MNGGTLEQEIMDISFRILILKLYTHYGTRNFNIFDDVKVQMITFSVLTIIQYQDKDVWNDHFHSSSKGCGSFWLFSYDKLAQRIKYL